MSCSICTPYVFADDFRDWQSFSGTDGVTTYLVGFGFAATSSFPSLTGEESIVFNPDFTNISYGVSDCGCSVGYVFSGQATTPAGWMSLPAVS